jgi:deoxyguanosine kinase
MIISIEGNIGSGKTTLVKLLKEKLKDNENFIFLQEPVDDWLKIADDSGESILTKFYNNQEKYSFAFQIMAYTSRMKLVKSAVTNNPDKIIIAERSIHTDRNVFAKMLYDDKKIESICYKIYNDMFDEFIDHTTDVNKIIFVDAAPYKCYERINKRNREGEKSIPLEYLDKCNTYHQTWLLGNANVLTLNGNVEFEHDDAILNEWMKQILEYVDNSQILL